MLRGQNIVFRPYLVRRSAQKTLGKASGPVWIVRRFEVYDHQISAKLAGALKSTLGQLKSASVWQSISADLLNLLLR
jgi:hypothetical protein